MNYSNSHYCQTLILMSIFYTANILTSLPAYSMDLNVKEISTGELLRALAAESGQNLVISDRIDDTITLNLHNVQWKDAIQTILKLKGLRQYQQNNITVIVTAEEATERQQELMAHQYFDIKHIPVERLLATIQASGLLSNLGKIGADTNSNSLLVTDRAENIQNLRRFIQHLDHPMRQIIIEARIVSIDSSVIRDLGIELSTSLKHLADQTIGKTNRHHNRQYAGNNKNILQFSLAKLDCYNNLDLKLSALENDGLAQVISSPKLVTVDHQAASIETGAEIPYQETNKDGYVSTIFKKAVLNLTVTPELITDDQVNMNITLNQDKVGGISINGQPSIDTRKIQTQTVAKNNETVVLGGIYEWSNSKNRSSMPILGELPLIKLLFSRDNRQLERRELLIFVTPRIIK